MFEELRGALLAGDLPLGERLGEELLAARFNVSRTPVREALQRLHTEGLLEEREDGGYEPAAPDLTRVLELYEVRLALELQAMRRPGEHGNRHDLTALAAVAAEWHALAQDPPAADASFVLMDEAYHVSLARAAGNQALADHLAWVNERVRAVRMHDFLTPDRMAATIDEHLSILDALIACDVAEAGARLTTHLHESMRIASARAAAAITRMEKLRDEAGGGAGWITTGATS